MIQVATIEGFEHALKNTYVTKDGYVCKITEDGSYQEIKGVSVCAGKGKKRIRTYDIFGVLRFGYKKGRSYTTKDKSQRASYYNMMIYDKTMKFERGTAMGDDVMILRLYKKESIEAYNNVCKRILKRKGKEYLRTVLEAV